MDALIHVLRVFDDPSVPLAGPIDPLKEIQDVEFDLMLSDLTQIEKRMERLEKDLKKGRTPELEAEQALLLRAKPHLEAEQPLRAMEMTADEKKLIRGYMFLSQKPVLYVLNISESTTLGTDLEAEVEKYGLASIAKRPGTGATAICGKVEAELAEMPDEEAEEFLSSYGLGESGLRRLIRKSYELLGLISFFTVGEDSVAPGRFPSTRAPRRLQEPSIPTWKNISFGAETIHWDTLLEAGSEAVARSHGTLRLEGKDYIVQDGDVMHIRHSG